MSETRYTVVAIEQAGSSNGLELKPDLNCKRSRLDTILYSLKNQKHSTCAEFDDKS